MPFGRVCILYVLLVPCKTRSVMSISLFPNWSTLAISSPLKLTPNVPPTCPTDRKTRVELSGGVRSTVVLYTPTPLAYSSDLMLGQGINCVRFTVGSHSLTVAELLTPVVFGYCGDQSCTVSDQLEGTAVAGRLSGSRVMVRFADVVAMHVTLEATTMSPVLETKLPQLVDSKCSSSACALKGLSLPMLRECVSGHPVSMRRSSYLLDDHSRRRCNSNIDRHSTFSERIRRDRRNRPGPQVDEVGSTTALER